MEIQNAQVESENNHEDIEDYQRQTVPKAPKPLSDGSREETPFHKYRHNWTTGQRLTLALLAEAFDNAWQDITSVFNHVHRSELRRCGGLRSIVVYTQYRDMLRHHFDIEAVTRKFQSTSSPCLRPQLLTTFRLQEKANEIGVKLIAKRPTEISKKRTFVDDGKFSTRKRPQFEDLRTDFLPSPSPTTKEEAPYLQVTYDLPTHPKTPQKTNSNEVNRGIHTPPDSRERNLRHTTTDKRLARIGFRAITAKSQGLYDPVLGLRAGAFLNSQNIPLVRDVDALRYQAEALHHVRKHDHTRPSMFLSATKNPIRAMHMLLHAPPGEKLLVLIDLNAADQFGNVEKAKDLKLQTDFTYVAAGEYLIFGGVDRKAIISEISLSKLLSIIQSDGDYFGINILQAHEKLLQARNDIRKNLHAMTYRLGLAVGQLVGNLGIPPKHFESGVWAFVQDYKFFNAEGGKRRGHWAQNSAFKDGALNGYRSLQANSSISLAFTEDLQSARDVVVIDDSDSDEEEFRPIEIADWLRSTQSSQPFLRYCDVESGKWISEEEKLSENFLAELRNTAGADATPQPGNIAGDTGTNVIGMDTNPVSEHLITVTTKDHIDELCSDVMHMHGDDAVSSIQTEHDANIDYQFVWTGM